MRLDVAVALLDLLRGAILGLALELFGFLTAFTFLAHLGPPLFKLPLGLLALHQKE